MNSFRSNGMTVSMLQINGRSSDPKPTLPRQPRGADKSEAKAAVSLGKFFILTYVLIYKTTNKPKKIYKLRKVTNNTNLELFRSLLKFKQQQKQEEFDYK